MDPSGMMNSPEMQERIRQVMSDPEVMAVMQQPGVMAKLQDAMSNPERMMALMHDPDVQLLMRKMQQQSTGSPSAPTPSPAAPASSSSSQAQQNIIHIRSQQQFQQVLGSHVLVVAKFTAAWCGPCQRIKPTYHELAASHSVPQKVAFIEIDGDQQSALSQQQQVRGFPTFHFYRNGVSVESFSGADEARLRGLVGRLVDEVSVSVVRVYRHFPLKDAESVYFTTCKYDAVIGQVRKCNAMVVLPTVALTDDEVELIASGVVVKLADTGTYHSSQFTDAEYVALGKLLSFPVEYGAPGLHLARMLLRHPHAAEHYSRWREPERGDDEKVSTIDNIDMVSVLLRHATEGVAVKPTNTLLALRALANAFSRRVYTKHVVARCEHIFDALTLVIGATPQVDAKVQLALTAVLINFAIVFKEKPAVYSAEKIHMLTLLSELLNNEATASSTVYRVLVILGTLVVGDADCRDVAVGMEVDECVKKARHHWGLGLDDNKDAEFIQQCADDILIETQTSSQQ